jgi:hypothetical protein
MGRIVNTFLVVGGVIVAVKLATSESGQEIIKNMMNDGKTMAAWGGVFGALGGALVEGNGSGTVKGAVKGAVKWGAVGAVWGGLTADSAPQESA